MTPGSVDVSVIVPTYNVEQYLPQALDRLLGQTHAEIEIVVVDDSSTDDSAEIGRRYADQHERVVFVSQNPNQGPAAARQLAFEVSHGDFVWFVDADDEWTDDAVAQLLASARVTSADVVCANADYVAVDGSTKPVGRLDAPRLIDGETAFRELLRGRITGHLWNKLIARPALQQIDFTRSRHHSDQAMMAQVLVVASKVALIEPVVYRYLLRGGSVIRSGAPRAESLETVAAVVRRCAEEIDQALPQTQDYRYYRARYEMLSRMKDATSGAYSAPMTATLVRKVRADTSLDLLWALARERDFKRLAMLSAGKTSLAAYQFIMSRPGARS